MKTIWKVLLGFGIISFAQIWQVVHVAADQMDRTDVREHMSAHSQMRESTASEDRSSHERITPVEQNLDRVEQSLDRVAEGTTWVPADRSAEGSFDSSERIQQGLDPSDVQPGSSGGDIVSGDSQGDSDEEPDIKDVGLPGHEHSKEIVRDHLNPVGEEHGGGTVQGAWHNHLGDLNIDPAGEEVAGDIKDVGLPMQDHTKEVVRDHFKGFGYPQPQPASTEEEEEDSADHDPENCEPNAGEELGGGEAGGGKPSQPPTQS